MYITSSFADFGMEVLMAQDLKVDDVVTCPRFALGWQPPGGEHVLVGERPTNDWFSDRSDESRSTAKYVVVSVVPAFTKEKGRQSEVFARRLNRNNTLSEDAELIKFTVIRNLPMMRESSIDIKEIRIVGRMRRVFSRYRGRRQRK